MSCGVSKPDSFCIKNAQDSNHRATTVLQIIQMIIRHRIRTVLSVTFQLIIDRL